VSDEVMIVGLLLIVFFALVSWGLTPRIAERLRKDDGTAEQPPEAAEEETRGDDAPRA
jgi:hypothetical protein